MRLFQQSHKPFFHQLSSFCAISALVLLPGLLRAQGTNATLTGTVTDSTGAEVAGAHITIRSVGTGFVQKLDSNGSGSYTATALPPGQYELTVERDGFRKYLQQGITLTVSEAATANVALEVGSADNTVTVTANAELINTTTAELSLVVNAAAITQLPAQRPRPFKPRTAGARHHQCAEHGRRLPAEAASRSLRRQALPPMAAARAAPTTCSTACRTRTRTCSWPRRSRTQMRRRSLRVITNNFDAHYGFSTPGAVVSIQTRSGANSFHGAAFEFLRNNDLNASDYFSHSTDTLKRNQFGRRSRRSHPAQQACFSLPITRARARLPNGTSNVAYTPTAAMLAGDFSAVPATLSAPFATVGGLRNQINPALFSPASVCDYDDGPAARPGCIERPE